MSTASKPKPQSQADPVLSTDGPAYTYKRASRYRRSVLDLLSFFGRRSAESHILCEVDMTEIERLRVQHKSAGHSVTATAFIIKAVALAQVESPTSRTFSIPFGRTVTYHDIVAGFTAEREVDGEAIVFFGEIEEPHLKTVSALAHELKEYCENDIMRVPKLKEQVLFCRLPWLLRQLILIAGLNFPFLRLMCMKSTFGISSLGSLGVRACYGPSVCTCVFGVGVVEPRVVVREGEIVIRDMMTLSLSFDQNVIDGGTAAKLLRDVRRLLESGLD